MQRCGCFGEGELESRSQSAAETLEGLKQAFGSGCACCGDFLGRHAW